MMRGLLIALILCFAALPAAAQIDPAAPEGCAAPELRALATVGMITDVVREVGGSCVAVTGLMGTGVDPHLYLATEADVELLFEAQIIFYGGLNLEARLTGVFEQVERGLGTPVVAVSESIPEELILQGLGYDAPDPHVWMDVSLWMYAVEAIRDALIERLPGRAGYLRANAEAYLDALEDLDAYVREQIARIPAEQRLLVTAHDAFQYFSRAYGIDVYAPQGITTAAEAGVDDIRATIALLIERQIPALFVETSVAPDVVEAIQAGARARGLDVQIGGSLFSDALGEEGTPEGTYIGMIRHNADTIAAALSGSAEQES